MQNGSVRSCWITFCCILSLECFAGEVVLDGFTASDLSDDVSLALSGANTDTFDIDETLGQRAGNNLFHSFLTFSLSSGEIALFSGDASIGNIIARVTGGSASLIDGSIQSSIDGASFWFVNPAGVVVNGNAQFDVSGSLALGAADFIESVSGGKFGVVLPLGDSNTLFVDAPVNFGFVTGSTAQGVSFTDVTLDESLSASGFGDVRIAGSTVLLDNSQLITSHNSAVVGDPGAGDVSLEANTGGSVVIRNGSLVRSEDLGANGSGDITVNADTIDLADSNIESNSEMTGAGGDITLSGNFLTVANSNIRTTTPTGITGAAAEINLFINNNISTTESLVESTVVGIDPFTGDGKGNITVHTASLSMDGGEISARANDSGGGVAGAGSIRIRGPAGTAVGLSNLTLLNGADIRSEILASDGNAAAGNIEILADPVSGVISLNGTGITPDISGLGGDAVLIQAAFDPKLAVITTAVANPDSQGAGEIRLVAGQMNTNHAGISTATGADVNLSGTAASDIPGAPPPPPPVAIQMDISGALNLADTQILASTGGVEKAGNINIFATSIVQDGGVIAALTEGSGSAGDITLAGPALDGGGLNSVSITNGGDLRSDAVNGTAGSSAGAINILADPVNGLVSIAGSGQPADLTGLENDVDALESALDPTLAEITSAAADPASRGAGNVMIQAGSISLTDTLISAATGSDDLVNAAVAGITLDAANSISLTRSGLVTATSGNVDAGSIALSGNSISLDANLVQAKRDFASGNTLLLDAAGLPRFESLGVNAQTTSGGAAGDIRFEGPGVNGENLLWVSVEKGADIRSDALSGTADSLAGTIQILADPVAGSVTLAGTGETGDLSGLAGDIDAMELALDPATTQISSVAGSANSRGAGIVTIQAGQISLANALVNTATASNRIGESTPAAVSLTAVDGIALVNSGIVSSTQGDVDAGSITLSATTVSIDGLVRLEQRDLANGNSLLVDATGLPRFFTESINAQTTDGGAAGNILIQGAAPLGAGLVSVNVLNGADIRSDALSGTSNSFGGTIDILADPTSGVVNISGTGIAPDLSGLEGDIDGLNLALDPVVSEITSAAGDPNSKGAGTITISAGDVFLTSALVSTASRSDVAAARAAATIRAGNSINLTGSGVVTATAGISDAGDVTLTAPDISMNGAAVLEIRDPFGNLVLDPSTGLPLFVPVGISAQTAGIGNAGDVTLSANDILLQNQALVGAATSGPGNAGVVTLNGVSSVITNPAGVANSAVVITSESQTGGSGSPGDIVITGGLIDLRDAEIRATTESSNPLNLPASITIDAQANSLVLTDSVVVATTRGVSDAGDITLSGSSVNVSGTRSAFDDSGVVLGQGVEASSQTADGGNAGSLTIDAVDILLADGAQVRATTSGGGDAGTIALTASDSICINTDVQGSPDLIADGVVISGESQTSSSGRAGSLVLSAPIIDVANATLRATTQSSQPGNDAASISLDAGAGDLTLTAASILAATEGTTDAGSITLSAGQMTLASASRVSAITRGAGNAGNISLVTPGFLAISGEGQGNPTVITSESQTSSSGSAGSILLQAGSMDLTDAEIRATTESSNSANTPASILLNGGSGDLSLTRSVVVSTTRGVSQAGDIDLLADVIDIQGTRTARDATGAEVGRGVEASSQTSDGGDAGAVNLIGRVISLGDGAQVRATTSGAGNAGVITISGLDGVRSNVDNQGTALSGAQVVISGESQTSTSGAAGSVDISGGSLQFANTDIRVTTESDNTLNAPATASVTSDSVVSLSDSTIQASTSGASHAGSVVVTGIDIETNGEILSETNSDGNAGDITINATTFTLTDDAEVASDVNAGSGEGGSVEINVTRLSMLGESEISSDTNPGSTGNGGSIRIGATQSVVLDLQVAPGEEAGIFTNSEGDGNAGLIEISTPFLDISGGVVTGRTLGAGAGGDIVILTEELGLNNAKLASESLGTGNAGDISVMGPAGANLGNVTLTNGSLIQTSTAGSGDAGDILIDAMGDVSIQSPVLTVAAQASGGAAGPTVGLVLPSGTTAIASQSSAPVNGGAAGSIQLNANNLTLSNALLVADTESGGSGNISVDARGEILLIDGSRVSTDTNGPGVGGAISLQAAGNVSILGSDTRVSSNANSAGNGGQVVIASKDLLLRGGATLSSTASGSGNSGSVDVTATGNVTLVSTSEEPRSLISTNSTQSQGGNITVTAQGGLDMRNSGIQASAGAQGSGGNISITSQDNFLRKSLILARADAGNGGEINISLTGKDQRFIKDSQSVVSADSNTGTSGQVNIDAPDTDLNAAIVPQDTNLTNVPQLTADICSPAALETQSSFVVMDQGGVAPAPDDYFIAGGDAGNTAPGTGASESEAARVGLSSMPDSEATAGTEQIASRGCE